MAGDTGQSAKWTMGFLFYFILYYLIVWAMVNANVAINGGTSTSLQGFSSYTVPTCDLPRCGVNGTGCVSGSEDSLDCGWINTKNECSTALGCVWKPVSSLSSTAHCEGNPTLIGYVNISNLYYPAPSELLPVNLGALLTGQHVLYNDTGHYTIPLSQTPYVSQGYTQCQAYGFTWYQSGTPTYEQTQAITQRNDAGGVINIIKTLFGFTTDLGIPSPWNIAFTFLFTYVPLIAFALIVRNQLPF